MQSYTKVISIAAVFLIDAATDVEKPFYWQLKKVILSGMYNCNFEAIN